MARSIGIDLGAYSVKVLLATSGFRQSSAVEFLEAPVPGGPGPGYLERAAAVVGELLRGKVSDQDSLFVAVTGDAVHTRVLEFGFKGLKRSELEKAVGSELEGLLPFDLDEIVFDFDSLPRDLTGVVEPEPGVTGQFEATDEEPTFVQVERAGGPAPGAVAPPASGMRVFAAAMNRDRAFDILQALGEQTEEPRGLIVGPTAYARIVDRIGALSGSSDPVAVIDLGHTRTNVCMARGGRVIFARALARGGQDVTRAIAGQFRMSEEEAERAKHSDGFIGSTVEPPPSDAWARIHSVVVTELEPLARELRRTFAACRAETGAGPSAAVLVGGGSRLRGLGSYLTEQLGIPVSTLAADDAERLLGTELASQGVPADVACAAAGVAFEGATGRPTFDLRRGDLAYKADFGFLRQKAAHIAAVVLLVIAFAAGNAYAALYKLRQDEKALVERCAVESTRVLGTNMTCEAILGQVGNVAYKEPSPLPTMTAYDILLELNSKLPDKESVTLNVRSIKIGPKKVDVRGTAASSAEIDEVEKKLKDVECFTDISKGSISDSGGAKSFQLTISHNCTGVE